MIRTTGKRDTAGFWAISGKEREGARHVTSARTPITSSVTSTAATRITVLTIESSPKGVAEERPDVTSRALSLRPETIAPHMKYTTGTVGSVMMKITPSNSQMDCVATYISRGWQRGHSGSRAARTQSQDGENQKFVRGFKTSSEG